MKIFEVFGQNLLTIFLHGSHHFGSVVFQMVYSLVYGWLTDGNQIGEGFDKIFWQLTTQETERANLRSTLEKACKRFPSRYIMNTNLFNKIETSLCYIRQSSYCR